MKGSAQQPASNSPPRKELWSRSMDHKAYRARMSLSSQLQDNSCSPDSQMRHRTSRDSYKLPNSSASDSEEARQYYRPTSHRVRTHSIRRRDQLHKTCHSHYRTPSPVGGQEQFYRGSTPSIPDMINPNPREFNRLSTALENLLPQDED